MPIPMRIENLYRYPVKGLSAEPLGAADVTPGNALPWDRAFALAQGDAQFDPAHPVFLRKSNFMCLLKNAGIAGLHAAFDPASGLLNIRAPDGTAIVTSPLTPDGRLALAAFLTAFLGDEARGTPVFHHVPGHVFDDQRSPAISLVSLPTLAQFERDIGAPRDAMRFRSNLYISGSAPWAEFDWVGHRLAIGTAVFRVVKRTNRCNATQVNPANAERDADPVRELMRTYGHPDLGVHMEVDRAGRIAVGDSLALID